MSELVANVEALNRQEGLGVEILLVTGEDDRNNCHRTQFPRTTERREPTSSFQFLRAECELHVTCIWPFIEFLQFKCHFFVLVGH